MTTLLVPIVFGAQTSTKLLQVCDTESRKLSRKEGGNEAMGCVFCIKHATSTYGVLIHKYGFIITRNTKI